MKARAPWLAPVWAEFAKIWALRFPPYACIGLVFYTLLIAYEDFHYGKMLERSNGLNAVTAAGFLLYSAWGKLILCAIFLIIFGVYTVAVESQYGMVRIATTQPLSRLRYALSKLVALAMHTAALAVLFCALLMGWSLAFAGVHGATAAQWANYLLSTALMIVMFVSWAWLGAAAALFRRTLLGAIMITFGILIAFLWVLIARPDWAAYNWVGYYFTPLRPAMPVSFHEAFPNWYAEIWKYVAVMFATPLALFVLSATHFSLRDITE